MNSAHWKVTKLKDSLGLQFFWDRFNLKQDWTLSLKGKKLLWKVSSSASKPLLPQMLKFGLCLKDDYTHFFCGRQHGEVPDHINDWHEIPLKDPKADLFGLQGGSAW